MKYYFITVMKDIGYLDEDPRFPFIEHHRTWGFYTCFSEADRVLHNNITDMHEGYFNYAVIEEYEEGISGYTGESWWFKFDYDLGCYTRIDKPVAIGMLGSIAFG